MGEVTGCIEYDADDIEAVRAQCEAEGNVPVERCPATGLVGTCMSGLAQHFYEAWGSAAQAEQTCLDQGGTWTAP